MTREEAIKIIRRYECNSEHYEACEMAIKALEQEPKLGHWIERPDGFKCSRCLIVHKYYSIYCPSCGKKMIEPLERSE